MVVKKTRSVRYEMRIVKVGCVREPEINPTKVTRPQDILSYINTIKDQMQEYFIAISLDGAGQIITSRVITIGLLNHSLVAPRETFRGAILDNATSIIVAHNHPSGTLEPSPQDIAISAQLRESGALLGIQLIDHIIVSKYGYVSMNERGLI